MEQATIEAYLRSSWPMTELAVITDIPFRRMLNWTSQHPLKIKPTSKVPGRKKAQFGFWDAIKFMIAHRLMTVGGMSGHATRYFLDDYRDQQEVLENVNQWLGRRVPCSRPLPGRLRLAAREPQDLVLRQSEEDFRTATQVTIAPASVGQLSAWLRSMLSCLTVLMPI